MALPDFFGINVGHYTLKIAQSKQSGSGAKLLSLGSIPTAFGLLDNESEESTENLAKEISKALKANNIKTKNCVLSIPEVSVFSRLLTLPKVSEAEASEAIIWALKPMVPMPVEDLNITFIEIDEKTVQNNTFTNWYVVAAPKNLIEKNIRIMEKAGLDLLAIETEALAITRTVYFNNPEIMGKDVMIIDFGAEGTNIILGRNGVVMFSQSIGTGSNAATKVISADFGIDMMQAEKYKITYGLDFTLGQGKIAKSMQPIIDIVVSELQRTMTYYKEKIGGESITKVYLTGGGANLLKFDQYLSEKLGLEIVLLNPLSKLQLDGSLQSKAAQLNLNSFAVAMGLSIKGITPY